MLVFNFKENKAVRNHLITVFVVLLSAFICQPPAFGQDTSSIDTLRQMGKAFAGIAEKASPCVVGISAQQVVTQKYPTMRDGPFGDQFSEDDFFERFFGRSYHHRRQPQRES